MDKEKRKLSLQADLSLWEKFKKNFIPLKKDKKNPLYQPPQLILIKASNPLPTTLDLHQHTCEEAFKETISFLKKHAKSNTQQVRIITGKGILNQGVIKKEFPNWMENKKISPLVQSLTLDSNGGAYLVYLKKKKK